MCVWNAAHSVLRINSGAMTFRYRARYDFTGFSDVPMCGCVTCSPTGASGGRGSISGPGHFRSRLRLHLLPSAVLDELQVGATWTLSQHSEARGLVAGSSYPGLSFFRLRNGQLCGAILRGGLFVSTA